MTKYSYQCYCLKINKIDIDRTIELTMVIKNFVTLTLINIRFVSVVMIKHL